jgi:imidazole glycerol-phosphate synthase subunit HisF
LKNIRIIPRLDIKGPNLVKGVHMEGLRVLGDPAKFAKTYYEQGADEIFYQDNVASLYGRNSLLEIINKTSKEIFIPLTVGGGIRSLNNIMEVLRAGADKVSINTAAVQNPEFINQASSAYGSSTIVLALECLKKEDGKYYIFTDNGREETNIEASRWALEVEKRGAGEIFLTSIGLEGTGGGFDLDLIKNISESVNIPVIAHGGASKHSHIKTTILDGKADAISLSSMLHYGLASKFELEEGQEGNTNYLVSKKNYKDFSQHTISSIKSRLSEQGINVRL